MPKFSVVIPLYNKQNYIENTLDSVLKQTYSNFEIIIVNDCSTDDSWDIVCKASDERIVRVEHEKNKGLSASRNTGILKSVGAYVAFLDADDHWDPHYLETMDSLITQFPQASLFASTYQLAFNNGKVIVHDLSFLEFEEVGILENFFTSNLNQQIYYPSCLTVQKDLFDEIGYYDEKIQFSEDIDFNIRAHAAHRMAFTKKPLVTYTVDSENQITQSPLGKKMIPNFDHYEQTYPSRLDIKKYLDFNRYVMAKMYRLHGDQKRSKFLIEQIDLKHLSWKQKWLLKLPRHLLKIVGATKQLLLKMGVSLNSYR